MNVEGSLIPNQTHQVQHPALMPASVQTGDFQSRDTSGGNTDYTPSACKAALPKSCEQTVCQKGRREAVMLKNPLTKGFQ